MTFSANSSFVQVNQQTIHLLNNVIIKDRYNFNDAVDIQSIPDILNAAKDIGFPYGIPRKIGQLWGSNDQEGAFIEINLGNYDELMKD